MMEESFDIYRSAEQCTLTNAHCTECDCRKCVVPINTSMKRMVDTLIRLRGI